MATKKTTCNLPAGLSECCINPSIVFKCPPHKSSEVCVDNQSDGAYVPRTVSYEEAYRQCKYIKQTSYQGQYKQFGSAFSNSFK
jgi:hypothetical protein